MFPIARCVCSPSALAVLILTPALACLPPAAHASSPFATSVVSYSPGVGAVPGYADPTAALGSPSRFTPDPNFPGSVTPFAPAYLPSQVVSIGAGGHLTLRFDQPVTNDPLNPFGIDLLIFGNSFFTDPGFAPVATLLAAEGGLIEVSPDGVLWTLAPNIAADGLWPTLGYLDESNPFGGPAGAIPTDFTRPVNPAAQWQGRTLPELIAIYDGSGGGAGVDLGALGLSAIQYVRLSLPAGATGKFEIDAISDVSPIPAPGVAAPFALAGLLALRRSRRP